MSIQVAEVDVGIAATNERTRHTHLGFNTEPVQDSPILPARGIVVAVLISIPFWTFCGLVGYLLMF